MTETMDSQFYTGYIPPDPAQRERWAEVVAADLGSRYEIREYLGHGAFATVWLAYDRGTRELLAVKRFHERLAQSQGFYGELRMLFKLSHPRVVRFVNLLESPSGSRHLILEYCPGGNLRKALSKARRTGALCPPARSFAIVRQVADGLAAAHAIGMAHRDLKPENILFDTREPDPLMGTAGVKLADFGLARVWERSRRDDGRLASISGSPAYMAPEQFTGHYTAASDVYAIGVLLFELLHGELPFFGSPEELAGLHLNTVPPIAGHIESSARDLLAALLAKRPEMRPTAIELRTALTPH